jgi:hypothetical protein
VKKIKVRVLTSEQHTLMHMPKFNGFGGGYGVYGDVKYNRKKEKQRLRKELDSR